MKRVRPTLCLLLSISTTIPALAADPPATAPAELLVDARLAHPHDKNRPADFKPAFADRAAWEQRAQFLREQVLVAQGLWPMPPKTPLNAVIHGKIDRDGYTIEKVFFASMPGHYVSGNLYRPTGRTGRLPAVLNPYGHWPDGRFIWKNDSGVKKELDSVGERTAEAARSPLQAGCAMMVRMGCVVFQYDTVGYCDSQKIVHRAGFLDAEAILRLQSFMGLQTWNSIRALDFLAGLPDVDPARIAVTGASSGGTQTIALAAVDPRPAASFPAVMVGMNMQGGCVCEYAPLYRVGTNNVELAALFAPKPEGAAAANDWTRDFMTRGLPEMKQVWGLYGAADRVEGRHFDFGHNVNVHSREMLYDFLNRELKLGLPSPVTEQPFVPVPPAELSVYDKDHPLPADAIDAEQLRKEMTRTSDAQLAELARNPDEYRRTLRVALQAMVVDALPAPADVESDGTAPLPPSAEGGTWTGTIARRGSGERVPCKAIFPKAWKGNVVVWSHPAGCASLTEGESGTPVPAARRMLESGAAVVAIDAFGSGEFRAPTPATPQRPGSAPPSSGEPLCYERSILANRVHDLLSGIALARGWHETRSVCLVGFKGSGPAALLTVALADAAVDRSAIDLTGFDFHQIHDTADPMLLPGGLKYGGILGFLSLDMHCTTLVGGAPSTSPVAAPSPRVTVERDQPGPERLAEWLLK